MTKETIWNVPLQHAAAFFHDQTDVTETGSHAFVFRSCRISIKELKPARTGIWSSKRVQLRLEGEDADVEEIYHRFFLRFLSMG